MPVIRGQASVSVLAADQRVELLQRLKQELAGQGAADGPVIFEIPLERSNRFDVVVVWKAFDSLTAEDRISLITEAYGNDQLKLALALGVTYEEAMAQQVLPYTVVPMTRAGEADPDELRRAMLQEGAFITPSGSVDLRFPTMAMAEDARHRLHERLPNGYWTIVQSFVPG